MLKFVIAGTACMAFVGTAIAADLAGEGTAGSLEDLCPQPTSGPELPPTPELLVRRAVLTKYWPRRHQQLSERPDFAPK